MLGSVIRNIQSIVINGVGHELLCNAEMRGQHAKAVPTTRRLLSEPTDGF